MIFHARNSSGEWRKFLVSLAALKQTAFNRQRGVNSIMPKAAHKIGSLCRILGSNRSFLTPFPGSLLFCPDCGTLLDLPTDDAEFIPCEQCGFKERASGERRVRARARFARHQIKLNYLLN